MKKIQMMMFLGYLLISIMIAMGYKKMMIIEETEVWSSEENVCSEMTEGDKESSIDLINISTSVPTVTEIPHDLARVTEAVNMVITLTEVSEIPDVTTKLSEPAKLSGKPETKEQEVIPTKIPVQDEEEINTKEENEKYKGVEISYINTSYRIHEETLEQLCSLIYSEDYLNSFVLYDIGSNAAICYNENYYFPVASTVKAPFALTCLRQIDEGLYSLEDTMKYTSEYKVRGSGVIKNEEIGKVYTIKELVEHAILVSDDIGYLMLQGYFGYEKYNQFLSELGNRVTIGNGIKWGQTSAMDSLRNWIEIYHYINSESKNAIFLSELLSNTNKSYIRNVLGEKYVVYNKMGWVYDQCCHDHAIIMDDQPYLLMIMTMGDVREKNQKFMEKLALLLNEIHEEMVYKEVK